MPLSCTPGVSETPRNISLLKGPSTSVQTLHPPDLTIKGKEKHPRPAHPPQAISPPNTVGIKLVILLCPLGPGAIAQGSIQPPAARLAGISPWSRSNSESSPSASSEATQWVKIHKLKPQREHKTMGCVKHQDLLNCCTVRTVFQSSIKTAT